jgi:predicted  nucleic acid-binding Zn-ribbon protein
MLCPQFCGTDIYWDSKLNYYVNTRNKKRHECPTAERAKEFMGKYNMIQIKTIRPHLQNIQQDLDEWMKKIQQDLHDLNNHIAYVERAINKKQAEKFDKRKQLGTKRNYQPT